MRLFLIPIRAGMYMIRVCNVHRAFVADAKEVDSESHSYLTPEFGVHSAHIPAAGFAITKSV